jgi:hypothetical protein
MTDVGRAQMVVQPVGGLSDRCHEAQIEQQLDPTHRSARLIRRAEHHGPPAGAPGARSPGQHPLSQGDLRREPDLTRVPGSPPGLVLAATQPTSW